MRCRGALDHPVRHEQQQQDDRTEQQQRTMVHAPQFAGTKLRCPGVEIWLLGTLLVVTGVRVTGQRVGMLARYRAGGVIVLVAVIGRILSAHFFTFLRSPTT